MFLFNQLKHEMVDSIVIKMNELEKYLACIPLGHFAFRLRHTLFIPGWEIHLFRLFIS